MRLLIAGSRGFDRYDLMRSALDRLLEGAEVDCVVSGGARGADSLGERWATEHGLRIERHLPDWETYGRSAGIRRNRQMCVSADILVAFWDGESRGTAFTIGFMRSLGKPVHVYTYR